VTTTTLILCALTACLLYALGVTVQALWRRGRGYRREPREKRVKYRNEPWR
jgi:hypothetical protein